MSKQVLKHLLDDFDSGALGGSKQSTSKGKEKTNKLKSAITKKKKTASTKSKTTKLSQIELYKALRASSSRHEPNLKNIKRKFFKHNPDQISGIGGSSNTGETTNKSHQAQFLVIEILKTLCQNNVKF
ncbi:hypothetical protein TYRP_002786 [Tyrophagus putrescentiae]|nr:hypothetical protein TYRP_002786 [Tyrophagus putrescentiae]